MDGRHPSPSSTASSLRTVPPHSPARGFALFVALVLLVIITITAFAGLRGTLLQQKMSAHQHDRQIAFEQAETALRVAQSRLNSHPEDVARNCQPGAAACLANPFNDPGLPRNGIHTVDGDDFAVAPEGAGRPQYVIENMGDWPGTTSDTVVEQGANAHNYGGHPVGLCTYYRITVRSADPAVTEGRMAVVLQATIEQRR